MAGGVLAVFAHPDDESLLAGGVLAAFAANALTLKTVFIVVRQPTRRSKHCDNHSMLTHWHCPPHIADLAG